MKKKIYLTIAVIFALVIVIAISITISNNKKANEIYQNCLGLTFTGKNEDDNGFASDYRRGTLDEYNVYYLDETECTLTFNEDGTVDWFKESDGTVLAFPEIIEKPDDYHYEDSGSYDSFSFSVSLNGKIFLLLGEESFVVAVDENNVLWRIWDFKGADLH